MTNLDKVTRRDINSSNIKKLIYEKKRILKIIFCKMFQLKTLILLSLALFLISEVRAQLNYCWDPSTGTQVACTAPTNVYCSTDFTSGIGQCSADNSNSSLLYCAETDGCNKFVTQCYSNHANKTRSSRFIGCDPTGADQYCQVICCLFFFAIKM